MDWGLGLGLELGLGFGLGLRFRSRVRGLALPCPVGGPWRARRRGPLPMYRDGDCAGTRIFQANEAFCCLYLPLAPRKVLGLDPDRPKAESWFECEMARVSCVRGV